MLSIRPGQVAAQHESGNGWDSRRNGCARGRRPGCVTISCALKQPGEARYHLSHRRTPLPGVRLRRADHRARDHRRNRARLCALPGPHRADRDHRPANRRSRTQPARRGARPPRWPQRRPRPRRRPERQTAPRHRQGRGARTVGSQGGVTSTPNDPTIQRSKGGCSNTGAKRLQPASASVFRPLVRAASLGSLDRWIVGS